MKVIVQGNNNLISVTEVSDSLRDQAKIILKLFLHKRSELPTDRRTCEMSDFADYVVAASTVVCDRSFCVAVENMR